MKYEKMIRLERHRSIFPRENRENSNFLTCSKKKNNNKDA